MLLVKNKALDLWIKMLLFTAIVHFCIIIFNAFKTRDWFSLNYLKIMGLDLIIPFNTHGWIGLIVSWVVLVIVLIVLYLIHEKNK